MNTIVCPKCFTKEELSALAYGCANSDCHRQGVPTTITGESVSCATCKQPMTLRFCRECGFPQSVGKKSIPSLPISVIGTQGAGKSHYISVLIQEIRQRVSKVYNSSLHPLGGDDTIQQYQKHYYEPLYLEKKVLNPTIQDIVRPMMYSLIFDNNKSGKTCNITFYDACGENFTNERVMAGYNRSVFNSSGVLFLVDLSQIPAIREDFISRGIPVSGEDYNAQLARTIALIRQGQGKADLQKKLDIPIAICVTKMDLIPERLDPSSFLNYPSRHLKSDAYDLVDHTACRMEMEALLESWSAHELIVQVKSQFEHVSFFGVSSLGSAPTADKAVPHVAPFRVADPFLWLLAKNNIIRSEWK